MRKLWALKYTPSPTYTGKRACQHSQNNAVFSPLPAHLTKGLWIVQLAAVWLVPRCYTNEKDILTRKCLSISECHDHHLACLADKALHYTDWLAYMYLQLSEAAPFCLDLKVVGYIAIDSSKWGSHISTYLCLSF